MMEQLQMTEAHRTRADEPHANFPCHAAWTLPDVQPKFQASRVVNVLTGWAPMRLSPACHL
jgi:hypothetical protein